MRQNNSKLGIALNVSMFTLIVSISTLIASIFMLCGCSKLYISAECNEQMADDNMHIVLSCLETKSSYSYENEIWDANIFAYDPYGSLAFHTFTSMKEAKEGEATINCRMLENVEYELFAIINTGFRLNEMNKDELEDWTLYLSRPEGNIRGIPMSGKTTVTFSSSAHDCRIELQRMMAKVSLHLDKSLLSNEVSLFVKEARVCNCPNRVKAFRTNFIEGSKDCFVHGYSCDMVSSYDLYLLENIPNDSAGHGCCSFVEMEFDYISPKYVTDGYSGLIYRFYIKDHNAHAVKRNAHYTITVQPRGDGLGSDGWEIDKSGLIEI